MAQPQQIAALGQCLAVQRGEDRDAQRIQAPRHRRLFAAPQRFAHPQNHRARIGDQRRVEHKDRVGAAFLWLVVVDHLGAGAQQDRHQRVVLLLGLRQVGPAGVVP